ncbi:hypothetical protein U1872_06205 [Sphingomonas sp. RB3P16]|uniref:hypothetical protein n=1 Tax=Parasphingomonas frigoris TaxID=3096163 RepID=UPI002FC99DBB
MIRHRTSPHELARAALDAAILGGRVAHHSGASDTLYRATAATVRELSGVARSTDAVAVELHETADGRVRAIIDNPAGYWDSIILAIDAGRIRSRAPC